MTVMQNPPSTSPMLANATTTPFDATAAKPASPLKSPKQASPVLKKASPALAPAVISAPEDEEKTIFNQAIIDTQPTLPIEPKVEHVPTFSHETTVTTSVPAAQEAAGQSISESFPQDSFQPESQEVSVQDASAQQESVVQADQSSAQQDSPAPTDELLLREQFKWLTKVVSNFKKRKDSVLFLEPVDPVKFGIPTYFDIIKHPMDVSTIDKKIIAKAYPSVDGALADFDLIFNNCWTFNGDTSPIGLQAKSCQAWLTKEVEKMPRTREEAIAMSMKKKAGRPSDASAIVRSSEGKRRQAAVAQLHKKPSIDLKFCQHVHKAFHLKGNQPFCSPFYLPVDPVALGIPTYFNVIKHPMDLSTVKKRLDSNEYFSAEDYEADVRLIIDNCFKFNPIGSHVYLLGQQFEAFFNNKWAEKNSFLHQHGEAKIKTTSVTYTDDDDDYDDDDAQQIQMIKQNIQLLNQQLEMLQEKHRKKKEKRKSLSAAASANHSAAQLPYYPPISAQSAPSYSAPRSAGLAAAAQAVKPKKAPSKRGRKKRVHASSDDEQMPQADITYEQKRELSDNISILPPEKLPQVFEIIKENANLNAVEDEEIELDIDSLEKHVLWKLYLFVKKHTRPPKKAKYETTTAGADHETTAVGQASSSSEAESDDSEEGDSQSAHGRPPIGSSSNMVASALLGRKSKLSRSRSGTVKSTTVSASSTIRKKPASPLPFRTEKGEITTFTSNFVTTGSTNAGAASTFSAASASVSTTTFVAAKPAPAPKPQLDSLLDMAWDVHDKKAEAVVPVAKQPEVQAAPPPTTIISPQTTSFMEPAPRSPTPESDYVDPSEWLDLQGPADMLQEFEKQVIGSGDVDASGQTVTTQTTQIQDMRDAYASKMKREIAGVHPDDIILNDETSHQREEVEFAASDDEEGAIST